MAELAETCEVMAILDPSPRYAGTSHDDATARAMGYRAALIPGVFVYGHATRPALVCWGEDWLARGRASIRFRRPVYNGDALLVARGPLTRKADSIDAEVTVTRTETGEVVLSGSIGLADRLPEPPRDLAVAPTFAPRMTVAAGEAPTGLRLGSAEAVLAAETVNQSLADFHETELLFGDKGLIHSGCLIRKTMSDTLGNLVLPLPVIFTAVDVQNFAPAAVGRSYATASTITRAWEARGRYYFETEEWLIADGQDVVARHIRSNLYALAA